MKKSRIVTCELLRVRGDPGSNTIAEAGRIAIPVVIGGIIAAAEAVDKQSSSSHC